MQFKTYYIKNTLKNRVEEINIIAQSHYDDKHEIVIIKSIFGSQETDENQETRSELISSNLVDSVLNTIDSKLKRYGYKEDFYELNDQLYNTYEDNTYKPSYVAKTCKLEDLEYPFYIQYDNKIQLHYNGKIRNEYGDVIKNDSLISLCEKVFNKIERPFDFVLGSNYISILDVMVENLEYANRRELIKQINIDKVTPLVGKLIENEEEFKKSISEIKDLGYNSIIVHNSDSYYIPSFNKSNSYLLDISELVDEVSTEVDTQILVEEENEERFVEELLKNYI